MTPMKAHRNNLSYLECIFFFSISSRNSLIAKRLWNRGLWVHIFGGESNCVSITKPRDKNQISLFFSWIHLGFYSDFTKKAHKTYKIDKMYSNSTSSAEIEYKMNMQTESIHSWCGPPQHYNKTTSIIIFWVQTE